MIGEKRRRISYKSCNFQHSITLFRSAESISSKDISNIVSALISDKNLLTVKLVCVSEKTQSPMKSWKLKLGIMDSTFQTSPSMYIHEGNVGTI